MEMRNLKNYRGLPRYPDTASRYRDKCIPYEQPRPAGSLGQVFPTYFPDLQYPTSGILAPDADVPMSCSAIVSPQYEVPQVPPPLANIDATQQLVATVSSSEKNERSFDRFWRIKKEAHWDIVASSKRVGRTGALTSPQARSRPSIWSETWHDAQDALPYFSVGQTILTSKVPRAQSRCVLLTKNLDNIKIDWRAGVIKFSMHLKYKLELTRPKTKNWQLPTLSPGCTLDDVPNPPEPLQFRKLKVCCDSGTPIKLLATGDFPSLPMVDSVVESSEGAEIQIDSNLWRNGVVVLGFFWVKKVEEVNPKPLSDNKFDINTGKCSGEAHWNFEFKGCDKPHPDWWCPLGGDGDSEDGTDDESNTPTKKARMDDTEALLSSDHQPMDVDKHSGGGDVYALPKCSSDAQPNEYPSSEDFIDPRLMNSKIDSSTNINIRNSSTTESFATPTGPEHSIFPIPQLPEPPRPAKLPNPTERPVTSETPQPVVTRVQPAQIGLDLNPKDWPNIEAVRPPQIRSSMLLGWHCKTCGKLNPRVKWVETQVCPLCKTTTKIAFPKWHRKAHTEAAGPIGTLYRLDDGGGHVHRTGLHAKAARDPENGMTIVKYWVADPYLPILAELGRIKPNARTRRGGLARPTPRPSQVGTPQSLSTASPMGGGTPLPVISVHPKVQRDVAGSRAMLPADTRVLFVHVTRPQHKHLLEVPDKIFSEFASTVPMERQINTKDYKTGKSSLSCHYTYLAGVGTSLLHTSTPAVRWDKVPDCVYNAQMRLTDMQCYNEGKDDEQDMFNQSVFVVGSGGNGVNSFRMIHRAEDGPVGYMVFGASCEVELMIGDGNGKRTTKAGAQRRTEVLMAHGDALFTAPPESDDSPIEVRVKRTGLAIIVVARYVKDVPAPPPVAESASAMEGVVYEKSTNGLKPPAPKARKRKSRG